ncbi:T-cell-interacting, activating receptor on myeloid cells protein 1 isoform X1 [Marmota flaviventris]|uniref:T-cell-interacting, activating receptor on myeloid cells protein 1 isoform X1 n=1 Tax=Marmota flaviventris TaxID=93162 RepID=UPI000FFFA785|nr:T-cell-interacting, activating receptor on myeloid cells protein 1 isoform X2 [Marmota flaviventris]
MEPRASHMPGLCVGQRDPPGDGSLPKPTLSAWPSSVVPAKSNVTLRCSSPVPGIRFILRKGPDILDSRLPLDPTKTTAEFLLTELGPRSAGPHTCECFWRGFSGVTSQLSNVLLLLVTGYLPKPSLQAHHVGQVTAGGEVTLQCQIPSTIVRPLESALLKAGTPSPVQLHRPVGSESDFSLQGVTVNDTGTYSCIYYQARAPFWASDPSPALDILVTVPPRASSEGYTKGNLVRLGVAAGVLLMGVVLVLEAWHASGVPHARPGSPQIPSAPVNPGQVGSAGLRQCPVPPGLPAP